MIPAGDAASQSYVPPTPHHNSATNIDDSCGRCRRPRVHDFQLCDQLLGWHQSRVPHFHTLISCPDSTMMLPAWLVTFICLCIIIKIFYLTFLLIYICELNAVFVNILLINKNILKFKNNISSLKYKTSHHLFRMVKVNI